VPEVVKVLTEHDTDDRHLGFSSDVLDPGDLMGTGAIDQNVREAIGNGVDPVTAVQAATLANAEALRVDHELGSIAPGKVADVLLVDDLVSFDIDRVVVGGEVVVYDDEVVADLNRPDYPDWALDTIDLPGPTSPDDFTVTVDDDREEATVRTIVIEDGSLITEEGEATLAVRDGEVQPDVADDVLKAASVDRHEASGRVANAFVEGYGLDEGAFAISVNSQRQNVSVIGTSGAELSAAVDRIAELDGGMVVVRDGEVLAEVPLRLFGLQSVASGEETMARFEDLYDAIAELGCDLGSPITNHEFINMTAGMASIRLSDYGLFDAITGEEFAVVKD
jgi:adenine deaminase